MIRSKWLLILCLGVALSAKSAPVPARLFVSHFENVLGTSMEFKVTAASELAADAAEQAALNEISRLNAILSAYDVNSEFSKWKQTLGKAVTVSKELFEVLSLFDSWRQRSGGVLNASAETIGKVWKQAAIEKRLPAEKELAEAVQLAQRQQWTLDPDRQTATRLSDAPLALNSFTKSYIIEHAANAAMASAQVQAVVVNIGGDIVIKGQTNEPVMISDPRADAENDLPLTSVQLGNRAIATSGDYRRGVRIGNNWYSHIVNPMTGRPAGEIISATVVSPNASDAGALATAFNLLTPQESAALAATVPGTDYLLVTASGERIASNGWKSLELKEPVPEPVYAGWNNEYELAIGFEIALMEGMRVRRPFVAVWIEDEKGKPVRNLSVWYNRDRWLPDLKSWYRHFGDSFRDDSKFRASVSSATRSPGKYSLKWDGKNDSGADMDPGKYVVVIEAAREHGTYQLMKQEIEIKKKPTPQSINLPGNVEISAASIELRKRSN